MRNRHLELHTLRRLAEWLEPYGKRWGLTASVIERGPVIELEVGYRAANALIGGGQ